MKKVHSFSHLYSQDTSFHMWVTVLVLLQCVPLKLTSFKKKREVWNKQWERSWAQHPKNERQKLFLVEVKGNIEMKIERRERRKKKFCREKMHIVQGGKKK